MSSRQAELLTEARDGAERGHADRHEIYAPELRDRIFEPFFTTKTAGAGNGLGLSICHSIVSAAGGRIDVAERCGGGALVRVTLPAAIGEPARTARSAPAAVLKRRILVVDDDDLVCKAIARVLRNHEVVVADSGTRALEHVRIDPAFDVILCDLMMPQMSGMELYERLLAEVPGLAARVAFMTGGSFTERASAFVATCGRPVLEKPMMRDELEEVVAELGADTSAHGRHSVATIAANAGSSASRQHVQVCASRTGRNATG